MVKSIVSMICAFLILISGAIFEDYFVHKQFLEFGDAVDVLYAKIDDESAVTEDVLAVQRLWLNKKQNLHAFIPHTEIKEIDLWLSEAVTLVRDKEWSDAISKIEVLKELAEQIPKTFEIRFQNVF